MADYIEINQTEIVLADAITEVGSFMQCAGETLEFHLALSDEAGTDGAGMLSSAYTVLSVVLKADGTEVASSNVSDAVVRGH